MMRRKAIRKRIETLEYKIECLLDDLTVARRTYPNTTYEARFKELIAELRGQIIALKYVGGFNQKGPFRWWDTLP